ncbi:MAG: sigma-70 family RNA polymerase sigma factor [Chloroflexi bacterium]|nr:sigma-70 family RNA polymerase sigma factor [Chloroflexota bacterium]
MVAGAGTVVGRKQDGVAADVDWTAVYVEYLPRVYNYFRFRTGNEPLAEDLTAQTFEQAWRGRARYRGDLSTLAAWPFIIARNVAASHFRRRQASPELSLEHAACHSDGRSPEDLVQRRSDLARVHILLAQLPPRERELIELKYGAALTNRAIARLTGLSESNVGTLLHRTVQRLRAAWDAPDRGDTKQEDAWASSVMTHPSLCIGTKRTTHSSRGCGSPHVPPSRRPCTIASPTR